MSKAVAKSDKQPRVLGMPEDVQLPPAQQRPHGNLIDPDTMRRYEELLKQPAPEGDWVQDLLESAWARIPAEEWASIPHDGSVNIDHYLYGHPKVSEE